MKKELAERNCHNCKKCWFGNYCEKLASQNNEYAEMMANQNVTKVSMFNEKMHKKWKIEKENCCDEFKSQFIEYPFVVNKMNFDDIEYNKSHRSGCLVKVRPCGDEYKNKTYLGFLLGDLPISINASLNQKTSKLKISTSRNPAIFIPEVGKIVFGCESWWGEITSEEQLKEISDDDIANVWYVKALKRLSEDKDEN